MVARFSAALLGSAIGYSLGVTGLPWIIWEIYGLLYGFAPLEYAVLPTWSPGCRSPYTAGRYTPRCPGPSSPDGCGSAARSGQRPYGGSSAASIPVGRFQIMSKYLFYSGSAALLGSLISSRVSR